MSVPVSVPSSSPLCSVNVWYTMSSLLKKWLDLFCQAQSQKSMEESNQLKAEPPLSDSRWIVNGFAISTTLPSGRRHYQGNVLQKMNPETETNKPKPVINSRWRHIAGMLGAKPIKEETHSALAVLGVRLSKHFTWYLGYMYMYVVTMSWRYEKCYICPQVIITWSCTVILQSCNHYQQSFLPITPLITIISYMTLATHNMS